MLVLILKWFKSRFSGTFEFFNRKTSDMLFSFPLPPSYGYTSYYANTVICVTEASNWI